jgi:SpoVK/Ycf46/Vps4 family AAA+-type ATPase
MFSDVLTTISTKLSWDDLVLDNETKQQIEEIVKYNSAIIKAPDLHKNGYKVLFDGPPGTGKKLTAALIGKKINKGVYKIDLSLLVSKYIGETEKNLEKIFTEAEKKEWILFLMKPMPCLASEQQ